MAITPRWRIIDRRRLTYEPEPTRFIYHHASELAPAAAEALIEAARAHAMQQARPEIETLISAVSREGGAVVAAGVPGGNTTLPRSLADILGSHSRIHAAEGVFYREVLMDTCKQMGFRVTCTPERDLWVVASKTCGLNDAALRDRLGAMRKEVGAPWGEDQKIATLAAFSALPS